MGRTYIGSTSDLVNRVYQHKTGFFKDSHSDRYNLDKLVWYEVQGDMEHAVVREKQLKKWNKSWKQRLVIESNPEWNDLSEDICPGITAEINNLRFPPSRE
jgi:putative endonuclease